MQCQQTLWSKTAKNKLLLQKPWKLLGLKMETDFKFNDYVIHLCHKTGLNLRADTNVVKYGNWDIKNILLKSFISQTPVFLYGWTTAKNLISKSKQYIKGCHESLQKKEKIFYGKLHFCALNSLWNQYFCFEILFR